MCKPLRTAFAVALLFLSFPWSAALADPTVGTYTTPNGSKAVSQGVEIIGKTSLGVRCVVGIDADCALSTTSAPPVGGATAARQDAQTADLDAIKTAAQAGATATAQALEAGKLDVLHADNGVIEGKQDTGAGKLDILHTDETALQALVGQVQASPTANTILDRLKTIHADLAAPLTVSTHAVTQSGGPWTFNLTQVGGSSLALGQAAAAASLPVVLSSDPDIRPGAATITAADVATTSTAGQDSVSNITGTPTANSFQTWAINGQSAVRVAISGTWTGALQFEGSADGGVTYVPIPLRVVGTVYTRSSVTGNGSFLGDVTGLTHFRVRETAAHSGTATIKPTFSAVGGPVNILNGVRVVDNGSGAGLTVKAASTAPATTDPSVVMGIADGNDVTLGAKADAANCAATNSLIACIRQLHADFIAATAAGENHIGEVGGNALTIANAQTVTASSAYASGNAVGGLVTLSNAARVTSGSGLVQSVIIDTKSAQTTSTDVVIFNANPSGSTCTDKTAFSVAAADFDKIVGVAHVTDWTSLGTPSVGQAQNLAMPFALSSGTTLYACVVTRGTPTYAATTDLSLALRVLRN